MSFCCVQKDSASAFVYTNGIPPRRLFDQATAYLELEDGPLIGVRLPQRAKTLMHILFTPQHIQLRSSHGLRFEDYDPRAIPFRTDSIIHLSIDQTCPGLAKTFVLKFLPEFEDAIRPFLRTLQKGHLASFGVLFPDKVAKRLGLWDDVPYMQTVAQTRSSKGKAKSSDYEHESGTDDDDSRPSSMIDVFQDASYNATSIGIQGSSNVLWVEPRVATSRGEDMDNDLVRPPTTRLVKGKQGVAEHGIFRPLAGQPLSMSKIKVRAIGIGAVVEKGEKEDELSRIWFCHGPFLLL